MRKVYQNERSFGGFIAAVLMAVALTALLFAIIPFAHRITKSSATVELRKTGATDLPPPTEDAPPPQAEEKQLWEAAPEPQLTEAPQQIPLSADLEVAAGSGGALVGFGDIRALTAAETVKDETFDVAELEKRPEAVSQVPPAYPAELRKAKIEGTVTLVFVLNEEGRVQEPRVENSSRPEFERPALEAIRKWRFRPGMKDGQAVRTYLRLPMRFRVAAG
jgi:protein TonB